MKKFTALSISLVLLSAAAFAQLADGISIGVEGEAALVPLIATQEVSEGANQAPSGQYTHFGHSDSGGPNFVQLNLAGENPEGTLGFAADFRVYGGVFDFSTIAVGLPETLPGYWGVDTNAHGWIKPFGSDVLKLTLGSFNEDLLRGKIGDSNWYAFTKPSGNADSIFTRLGGRNGALISSVPVEGLFIGILAGADGVNLVDYFTAQVDADTIYQFLQGAVGYTIEGVGLVRAQYVGKATSITTASPTDPEALFSRAELAFAYTGVEGLIIDLGGKVPFAVADWDPVSSNKIVFQAPYGVSLGAEFASGDFKITGRVDGEFGKSYKETDVVSVSFGPEIGILLVPEYTLSAVDANLKVGVDVSALIHGDSTSKNEITDVSTTAKGGFELGFGLWAQKDVSNGWIKAGLAYQLQSVAHANGSGTLDDEIAQGAFSIPIVIGFSF
ncbi:MAG: hypothetical protein LBK27_01085 [Treponema sp.]|jgi:hypothetical protein|nr:hypothetical protein [Treponema sp.]